MNIIFLILFSTIVLIEGAGPGSPCNDHSSSDLSESEIEEEEYEHQSLPLTDVRMEITQIGTFIFSKRVELKLVRRVLANENLPVWVMDGTVDERNLEDENSHDLKRNYKVMKEVGEFSTYQQSKTSSAAVYFHKRQQFDGVIDTRISIRGLPVKFIDPVGYARLWLGHHGINRNKEMQKHTTSERKKVYPAVSLNLDNINFMRTYQGHVFDGYPEILIVVAWDVVKDWTMGMTLNEMDLYTTIVSYVITLFNGVDMLYSKLQDSKIQINIAGIVIGTERESFSFLDECYHQVPNRGVTEEKMDTTCTIKKLQIYLAARKKILQPESYDLVVFLTGKKLIRIYGDDKNGPKKFYKLVEGTAGSYKNLYEMKKRNMMTTLIAVVHQEKGDFGKYPNIAHEIGHMMTLDHDLPPYFTDKGKCCANLMKETSTRCSECLLWSPSSEKTFSLFFSSPHCCTFINEPQSLLPPGRYQMLTLDEQC